MGGNVLDNQTLIAHNTREDGRLLNSPLANVLPVLFGLGVLLLSVRWGPSRVPVISELLEEGCFDGSRLETDISSCSTEPTPNVCLLRKYIAITQ